MEKKLKNVIGAPVGKTAVAHITHMELKSPEPLSRSEPDDNSGSASNGGRITNVVEWLRQLISLQRFYKRKENFLVSVKDIFTYIGELFRFNFDITHIW